MQQEADKNEEPLVCVKLDVALTPEFTNISTSLRKTFTRRFQYGIH
jgi:hypothetical protein